MESEVGKYEEPEQVKEFGRESRERREGIEMACRDGNQMTKRGNA